MTIWNLLCTNVDGRIEAENMMTDTVSELAKLGRNILFRNSAAIFRERNVGGIKIAHTAPVYQNCRLRREM